MSISRFAHCWGGNTLDAWCGLVGGVRWKGYPEFFEAQLLRFNLDFLADHADTPAVPWSKQGAEEN